MQPQLPKNVDSWEVRPNYEIVNGKNGKTVWITWKGVAAWSRLYIFSVEGQIVDEYKTSAAHPTINTLEHASELLKKLNNDTDS